MNNAENLTFGNTLLPAVFCREEEELIANVWQLYAVVCRICAVGKLRIGAVSSRFYYELLT
jgi:hypothetical protein